MLSPSTTDNFTLHTTPGDFNFTGNTATIAFTGVTYEYTDPTPTTHEFTSLDASITSTFTLTVNPPTGDTLAINGIEASSPAGPLPGTGGLTWSPTSTGGLILTFTAPDNTGETIDWNINITSAPIAPVKLTVKIVRL